MNHKIIVGRYSTKDNPGTAIIGKAIRIDRLSPLGNPFKVDARYDRARVIEMYRAYMETEPAKNPAVAAALDAIQSAAIEGNVTLLCWCAPKPCHGDVIADIIRKRFE